VESVRDYALFQMDREGRILAWNTGAQRLLGWQEEEAVGRSSAFVFTPEDVANGEPEKELETARTTGRAEDERWHLRKDGTRFFASGVLSSVCDEENNLLGFAKIMRDITASREQEKQLRRSIEEKTTLVREIHHRVKNNLQVIVSLLSLQSSYTDDPRLLAAFEETEARLRAIAHIHERLYASEDLREVEFGAYLAHLTQELAAIHATSPERVTVELDVRDMVLHIEQAIPMGLIANELILNSLKHGVRGGPGRLRVTLSHLDGSFQPGNGETADDGWAEVRVMDTGPGLPSGFDVSQTNSMGFRLINLLVRQVRGRVQIADGPGADIGVRFPINIGL
jgi:PAS domain S-box-containing protein